MTETDTRAAIGALTEAVNEAVAYFRAVDAPPRDGDDWGPREVLGHLLFWHDYVVEALETARQGGLQPRPEGDQPEINGRAAAMYRDVPTEKQLAHLLASHATLSERFLALPDPHVIVMKRGGTGELASAIQTVGNWTRHIRSHLTELREQEGQAPA